jgi:YHS domain-containing protein
MKNIFFALSLCLFLSACGDKKAQSNVSTKETKKNAIPLSVITFDKDPVCLMPISGGIEDSTTHKNVTYGFCCSGCKDEFLAKPEEFLVKK